MEWISVKDRLPSECEKVIVFVRLENDVDVYMAYIYTIYDEELDMEVKQWSGFWGNKVTHWMPLPEHPKQ